MSIATPSGTLSTPISSTYPPAPLKNGSDTAKFTGALHNSLTPSPGKPMRTVQAARPANEAAASAPSSPTEMTSQVSQIVSPEAAAGDEEASLQDKIGDVVQHTISLSSMDPLGRMSGEQYGKAMKEALPFLMGAAGMEARGMTGPGDTIKNYAGVVRNIQRESGYTLNDQVEIIKAGAIKQTNIDPDDWLSDAQRDSVRQQSLPFLSVAAEMEAQGITDPGDTVSNYTSELRSIVGPMIREAIVAQVPRSSGALAQMETQSFQSLGPARGDAVLGRADADLVRDARAEVAGEIPRGQAAANYVGNVSRYTANALYPLQGSYGDYSAHNPQGLTPGLTGWNAPPLERVLANDLYARYDPSPASKMSMQYQARIATLAQGLNKLHITALAPGALAGSDYDRDLYQLGMQAVFDKEPSFSADGKLQGDAGSVLLRAANDTFARSTLRPDNEPGGTSFGKPISQLSDKEKIGAVVEYLAQPVPSGETQRTRVPFFDPFILFTPRGAVRAGLGRPIYTAKTNVTGNSGGQAKPPPTAGNEAVLRLKGGGEGYPHRGGTPRKTGASGGVATTRRTHPITAWDLAQVNPRSHTVVKDLREFAARMDVSSSPGGAVYWGTPNMKHAQDWAQLTNQVTLEMTKGGRILDQLNLFDKNSPTSLAQAAQIWDIASARYAKATSGTVDVFPGPRKGDWGLRTWARSERPILTGSKPGWMLEHDAKAYAPTKGMLDYLPDNTPNTKVTKIIERGPDGTITGVDYQKPARQMPVMPGRPRLNSDPGTPPRHPANAPNSPPVLPRYSPTPTATGGSTITTTLPPFKTLPARQ